MAKTSKEVMDRLPSERCEKIDERAEELIAEIMTLRDLRKAREQTQACIAETLEMTQENISRIEKRSDLLISTLRRHVEALGGQLSLVARFPDRPPVELAGIADLDDGSLRPGREAGEKFLL